MRATGAQLNPGCKARNVFTIYLAFGIDSRAQIAFNEEIMMGQTIEADSLLTSHEVGDLLQVNPSSINKWVNEGRITAFRTPGGHRRIRASDLVRFLDGHKMPIPKMLAGVSKRR